MFLSFYHSIHSLIYLFIHLSIYICLSALVYCANFTCIRHLLSKLFRNRHGMHPPSCFGGGGGVKLQGRVRNFYFGGGGGVILLEGG